MDVTIRDTADGLKKIISFNDPHQNRSYSLNQDELQKVENFIREIKGR